MRDRIELSQSLDKRYLGDGQGRVLMQAQFVGFDEPSGAVMIKARPNAPVQSFDIGANELTYGQREELSAQLMMRDDLAFEVRPSASGPQGLGIWEFRPEVGGGGVAERIEAPAPRADALQGDEVAHEAAEIVPRYERQPRQEEEHEEESQGMRM